MTLFSIDHDLPVFFLHLLESIPDLILEVQYYRTGCIDKLKVVFQSDTVSFRGFTMSPDQDFAIPQPVEFIVFNDNKAHILQPFHLHVIMNNITQAIEFITLCQFPFSDFNGVNNAKAKPGMRIYCYLHIKEMVQQRYKNKLDRRTGGQADKFF